MSNNFLTLISDFQYNSEYWDFSTDFGDLTNWFCEAIKKEFAITVRDMDVLMDIRHQPMCVEFYFREFEPNDGMFKLDLKSLLGECVTNLEYLEPGTVAHIKENRDFLASIVNRLDKLLEKGEV